jgi:hypothetical protein
VRDERREGEREREQARTWNGKPTVLTVSRCCCLDLNWVCAGDENVIVSLLSVQFHASS